MTPGTAPVTSDLAEALARLRPAELTATARQRAVVGFLDTIAVMAAGLDEPPVLRLRKTLGCADGRPDNARDRALVMGTAAHALDFDDVAFGGHVSAVIVPAILALLPDADAACPDRMLLAYAAGIEAWSEVSGRETVMYHAKGGHPTGLLGPIGAAGAAACLLGLGPEATRNALAMAASLGSGLTVNFGTMTKPLHAGRAAEAGVLAALLARDGMTAAPDGIEAPNGFLAVHSPTGAPDLGRPVALKAAPLRLGAVSPSVKRFPVCYAAHRATDAALALHALPGLERNAIAAIAITTSPRHSGTLRYRDPQTVAEARFSLEFAVCRALQTGGLGLSDLQDEPLHDPELRALMALCTRQISGEADPVLDGYATHDAVTLTLRNGKTLESPRIVRPTGHADNPLTPGDLTAKLTDCLSRHRAAPSAERLEAVMADIATAQPGSAALLDGLVAGLW